jgi:prepilin-type N-terminal cleavage/methylation domain-containing protein
MMRNYKSTVSSAFTIIELLVVIAIIGILAAITLVSYSGVTNRATIASIQSDLTSNSQQLRLFQVDSSNYPATISTDCVAQPSTATNKCLKASPGTSYEYYVDNTTNNQTFCITATKGNYSYSINNTGSTIPAPYCPILYLDASNSLSYPGSGNNKWYDLSGNNNNGTISGATYSSGNGGAFGFDGVSSYVGLDYVLGVVSNQLSVSSWIKPTNVSGGYEISNQNQWDTGPWTGYRFRQINSSINLKLGDGSSIYYECTGGSLTPGVWQYVTGVWDGSYIRMYLNGIEVVSCAKSFTYLGNLGTHSIGKYAGSAYFFNGLISRLEVYKKAISAGNVLSIFNATKGRYGL